MSFDPTIGLGSIILFVTLALGGIGTWFTIKVKIDQLWGRMTKQDDQHQENQTRMQVIELQIARECVKVEDFRRLEDKMGQRFEKMEHVVNNGVMKTEQALKNVLRDLLPHGRARE